MVVYLYPIERGVSIPACILDVEGCALYIYACESDSNHLGNAQLHMTRFLIAFVFLLILFESCKKDEQAFFDNPSDTIPLVTDTIPLGPDDPVDPPSTDTTIRITPCSLWQGHVVAIVDTLAGGAIELTLVSLVDYDKIYSASSTSANFDTLVRNYQEYDLSGWRIPTESEVRRLKAAYNDSDSSLLRINALFRSQEADTIASVKGSQAVRYLCQDATKTYSHHTGTNVTNADSNTKYRLRLVHTYRLATKHQHQ